MSSDLVDTQNCGLKEAPAEAKSKAARLSPRERGIIGGLRKLPAADQEKVYAAIKALLRAAGRKGGKTGR